MVEAVQCACNDSSPVGNMKKYGEKEPSENNRPYSLEANMPSSRCRTGDLTELHIP